MILVLGGTSDSVAVTMPLAEAGYEVLVSMASDIELNVGTHRRITRRRGRLDLAALVDLIEQKHVDAVVDVTHPYATDIRSIARQAAFQANRPYLTYIRPSVINDTDEVIWAGDHEEAAELAFQFGRSVLLTTGSRNLTPYVKQSKLTETPLFARVLDCRESLEACLLEGLTEESVILGRGPFSLDDNRRLIKRHLIGVIVTKDGGKASAVLDKLIAAREKGCNFITVRRPELSQRNAFEDVAQLVDKLRHLMAPITDEPRHTG